MNERSETPVVDAAEAKAPSALLPRFTIKTALVGTAALAVIFLVVRFAMRADHWAISIVMAVLCIAVLAIVSAVFFVATFSLSLLSRVGRRPPASASPFATDALPPQIIPPQGSNVGVD